jgi:hypothetical protein
LCLWLPRWPIERLRSVRPELKRQEIALHEADRRGLLRISVYSGRHGIRPGMPLAEAMSLARVHFEQHDRTADHAALGQHVGGLVMTQGPLCELVPIENASMEGRTVIEWDKDDLDELGILKVDCLSLGMLTAIHKCFDLVDEGARNEERVTKMRLIPRTPRSSILTPRPSH